MSPKPLREQLSFRAYAKRRNPPVSHTAVEKAIKSGRLKHCLVRVGKRILIDPSLADREWERNTDEAFQRETEARAGGAAKGQAPPNRGKKTKQKGLYGADVEEGADEADPNEGAELEPRGPTPAKMRGILIGIQAQHAKLDLEVKMGQLVRRSESAAEAFRLGRGILEALQRLPPRYTGELMNEKDPHVFERRFLEVLMKAVRDFVEKMGSNNA